MLLKKKYSWITKFLWTLLIIIIGFSTFVHIANRNSKNMTARQKVLKSVYPIMMWFTKTAGINNTSLSYKESMPVISLYSLQNQRTDGTQVNFSQYKGKKILLVNTASDCGYTGQYDALEELSRIYKDKLVVLGFPANDFKEQEKGTDENIAPFAN